MADVDAKIAEAEIKLEQNDFPGAIEDYRSAAVHMPVAIGLVLGNLSVAEVQERLAFARELANLYPDSLPAVFREARLLYEGGFILPAIERFTDLIALSKDDPVESTRARRGRLEASLRAGASSVFIEDFSWLWQTAVLPTQKHDLLRILAQIKQADFIPVLERLLELDIFPSEIGEFVRSKISELEHLKRASVSLERD